ncbi:alpha/beta fold hydrolase [Celeribacter persicus]|uniref:alpha/beta fold hydrolase n=1 Tax=Celeribacter persicus TaxID=1651082 RepID=UPI001473145B|nr:alpha/beta hydrolase [Celeribacter persicus]
MPSEDALLHLREDEASSEQFFFRSFSNCRLPANLYDHDGNRQIHSIVSQSDSLFPPVIHMPGNLASGCTFVVVDERLYFLYDRVERWSDVPDHVAFVAVRLDAERIAALAENATDVRLTPSEYLLLSHLLTGLDLKTAAARLGASYDTKRKQIQVILDKMGCKTQTVLLRNLSLEITAGILDEILPLQKRDFETALVKRQFGKDVIVNTISIGDGIDVPVWEFGARRGRPVLYFHSMLAPVVFHDEMIDTLKENGLRWLVVPRHFLGFEGNLDVQTRLARLTRALSDTMEYLTDEPLICVAESAGVTWAAHFARHNPHMVSQLVLAATPQVFKPEPGSHNPTIFIEMSQRVRRDERVIAGLTQIYNAFSRVPVLAKKGLAHLYRKSAADTACLETFFRHTHLSDWLRLIANHATFASVDEIANLQRDWLGDLKKTTCRVTFVHGEEDPISPIEDIQAIAETMPEASFHAFENAGHLILTQHFKALVSQMIAHEGLAHAAS